MKYYKFVGSARNAENYKGDYPKVGRVYRGNTKIGSAERKVEKWAMDNTLDIDKEWQEVSEQEYLSQDYYKGCPNTLTVTFDTGAIKQTPDLVSKPPHYNQGEVECIEAIKSATINKKGIEAVCVANVIKYLWRYEDKEGLQDVKKAQWYLDKLAKEYGKDKE